MAKKNWMPLTEYSSKYNVSVSTLRRRIKTQQVEFTYKDGKYLLLDKPLDLYKKDMGTGHYRKEGHSLLSHQKKSVDSLSGYEASHGKQTMPMSIQKRGIDEYSAHLGEVMDKHLGPEEQSLDLPREHEAHVNITPAPPQSHTGARMAEASLEAKPLQNSRSPTQEEVVEASMEVEEPQGFQKPTAERLAQALSDVEKETPASHLRDEVATEPKNSQVRDVLATTNRLLDELKKAYSLILQEKEEQMILIQDEVANLKTLVYALEEENRRLRERAGGAEAFSSTPSWLDSSP